MAQSQVDETILFRFLLDSRQRKPYICSPYNTDEAVYDLQVTAIHQNSCSLCVSWFDCVRRRLVLLPTLLRLMRTCLHPKHRPIQKDHASPYVDP